VSLIDVVTPLVLGELDEARVHPGQSMPKNAAAVELSNCRSFGLLAAEALPTTNENRLANKDFLHNSACRA
jgi:hypothetical protein